MIAPQFDDARWFAEGLAAVKRDEQWGCINPAGQMVIAPRFESALWFFEGCARVKLDGQWGYVNAQGVVVRVNRSVKALLWQRKQSFRSFHLRNRLFRE
ncbi:hypothetical protein U27_02211 [Candidatus Vecturithrix granuli]|uniref:WG repeat-containing protein n=1 Tax=Vecturithrix granuli TaxID=1499967 RepID=A0A0S6WA48_VECG1|nr:hypothetical protein U27_02211 [Candidatus Vecturithrix granuli]